METVLRWAHQGGAREGPTNTLAAMTMAMDAARGGANALEFDVHRTKDGAVVVIHDPTLERTTNGKGKVSHHTLEDLRRLDAAYWWVPGEIVDHNAADETAYEHRHKAPGDRMYGIPTIEEVLDRFPDIPLTIEIKSWRAARPLIDRLAERDRRNVTVTSLRDHIVWRAGLRARKHPEWKTTFAPGWLYSLWFLARTRLGRPPRPARYGRIQVPRRKLIFHFAQPSFVKAAHRAGMQVDYWTIDDPDEMQELLALGADGIMTDKPSVLAEVIRPSRLMR
jgi:glycerophosphoryl diester phosphodiesterase